MATGIDMDDTAPATLDEIAQEWAWRLLKGRVLCIKDVARRLNISPEMARGGLQRLMDYGAVVETMGYGQECVRLEPNGLHSSDVSVRDLLALRVLPGHVMDLVELVVLYSEPFEEKVYRMRREQREHEVAKRSRRRNGAKTLKDRLLAYR